MERLPFIGQKIRDSIERHEVKRWRLKNTDYFSEHRNLISVFNPTQRVIDYYKKTEYFCKRGITVHTVQAEYLTDWVESQKRMGLWDRVIEEVNKKERVTSYELHSFEHFVSNLQEGLIYVGNPKNPPSRTIFLDLLSGKFSYAPYPEIESEQTNPHAKSDWGRLSYRKKIYPVSKDDLSLLCKRGEVNLKKISALDILQELRKNKINNIVRL